MKNVATTAKRVVILWLISISIGAVVGCDPDDCGGAVRYGIDGIMGISVRFTVGPLPEDTLKAGATVPYDQYALLITPLADHRAEITPSVGSWLGRAYACDPAIVPTDQLAGIVISSDTDFTASNGRTVSAGNTLNEFFNVRSEYGLVTESLVSYVSSLPAPAKEYWFAMILNVAPDEAQSHQFTVHYQLTNGKSYRFTSDPVTITS